MSLYREAGAVRRRRRLVIGGGIAALVLVVLAVVLIAGGGDDESPASEARAAAEEVANGLEVLSVEYEQAVGGEASELVGVKGNVQRSLDTLQDHRAALRSVDAAAAAEAVVKVRALGALIDRKVAPQQLQTGIDAARSALDPFL